MNRLAVGAELRVIVAPIPRNLAASSYRALRRAYDKALACWAAVGVGAEGAADATAGT
jgi:hypothetical protein